METSNTWPAMTFAEADAILTAPGAYFELEDVEVGGNRVRNWKNSLATLRDAFECARAYGDRDFLVYADERISFSAFAKATTHLAHALIAKGVGKGDRVAIAMRNMPEWAVAFYGSVLTGAIVNPINAMWLGEELEYGLRDAGAKLLIADGERFDRVQPHIDACPDLIAVIVARPSRPLPDSIAPFDALIGSPKDWERLAERAVPDVTIAPDDDATIFFTSGTTGHPKGALSTHRNIMGSLIAGGYNFARTMLRSGLPLTPPNPDAPPRTNLLSMPLFNGNGCMLQLLPGLVSGTKQVLMHKWEPEEAMRLIERERVNSAGGVPTMALQLIEHPARDKYDLSSLDAIGWGGATSAPDLVDRVHAALPSAGVGSGWGMTETSSGVTGIAGLDYAAHPDSAGVVFPAWDLQVLDPTGTPVPTGEVGELWVKGPGVFKGYWNRSQATAETIIGGWLRTGDLVRLDDKGLLYVVDRAKDMIIRGGQNIYSVEIEHVLQQHPAVSEVAVVPVPHRELGETPGAIVYPLPGSTLSDDELRDFASVRLAKFKVPDRILIVSEPLPRNASGKILKRELREKFAR